MIRASLYVCVSTTEQSIDNQLPALESYCQSKGYTITAIYSESESAYKSGRQVELQRLMDDCRNGKGFDILLVWDLSRLSRQGIARILNLIEYFKVYRVKVVSLKETWTETEGPMKDLLFAVFGWAAQYESAIKSERTKAGLARAIATGKTLGRPVGSKDGRKRHRRGYLLRYAGEYVT
jgi:putative DNA-invertase from lambdoid prophage Rac